MAERTTGRPVAVVTGAAAGLGRAYAERLGADGFEVLGFDRDFEPGPGRRRVDVTDVAAVEGAVAEVLEAHGRIDVLVCNAGGGSGALSENRASEVDLDAFDRVLRINLLGTVHCCRAAAPAMKGRGGGSIITVSSDAGLLPSQDGSYAHYGTAKAAVAMYSRYLARDLGPDGVRVNCIAPGPIVTDRLRQHFEDVGVDNMAAELPLRRLGTVEDCAALVSFLADPAQSGWITGQVISPDGGGSQSWVA